MKDHPFKKPHYAWYILAVCFLLNMVVQAFIMSVSNLYVVPIWREFQVPRSLVTMQSICITVSSVLSAPVWGRLYKRKNARVLLPLAVCGTALCSFLRAFCPGILSVLLLAFVKGVFFTGSTLLPISVLLTAWFAAKRGFAISLAAIGSSVGGVFLSPFVEYLISAYGWRSADRIMGTLLFAFCVPLTFLVIRNRPKDLGLFPYGAKTEASPHPAKSASFTACGKQKLLSVKTEKSPVFFLFLFAVFCMTFANGAALQLPTYLVDIGYASAAAAQTVSAYMLVGIPGKLFLGWIADRFGVKTALVYNCLIGALSFLFFALAGHSAALFGIVLCFGLTSGITSMLPTLLTAALFSDRDYALIYGIVVSINRFGGGIGTLMVAVLFDLTGAYRIIWPLCLLMMLLTMCCILLCFFLRGNAK